MFYSLWTSGYTIRRKRATNIATGPCRQRECSGPEAAEADHIATDHKWRIKNGIPPAPLGVRSSIARSVISKRRTEGWLRDHAEERLSGVFQDNYDHGNAAVHICRHIWLVPSAVSSNEYRLHWRGSNSDLPTHKYKAQIQQWYRGRCFAQKLHIAMAVKLPCASNNIVIVTGKQ